MKLKDSNSSYYITCLMSGAIELGAVFLGMKMGYSLLGIIGLALAYQLGNVFRFFCNEKDIYIPESYCIVSNYIKCVRLSDSQYGSDSLSMHLFDASPLFYGTSKC